MTESDTVFVDSLLDSPRLSYRPHSKDAITLGSGGSSNGGLEVFEERDEDELREKKDEECENKLDTNHIKVNGYRSSSASPKKITNGYIPEDVIDTSTLQRRESKLKKIKRRLSESFVRRDGYTNYPKTRPNSLNIIGKNGGIRRNSIATVQSTDTIGPSSTSTKPLDAFGSTGHLTIRSATLPHRRYSTTTSPLESPFGRLETYKRLEQLGEGSYATVYKGISTVTGHMIALKEIRLNSEEGTPFTAIREASLLKGLKHFNIVTLHDIIHTPNNLTFVFEYVDTDLSRYMERHPGPMDTRNVKVLMVQLLRGLLYCHKRKILHRDLKPQNILLNHNGELKLADFGLARAKSVPTKTYSNEVVTLWYRPPDVLLGSTEYSTSLDMWGVGCIFVEMLTGKPLFPGIKGVYDQLNRIWAILGTPDESTWPGINEFTEYIPKYFEKYQYIGVEAVSPILLPQTKSGDFAERILRLIPSERLSAEDALAHEYFASLPPALFTLPDKTSIFLLPGILFYR